MKTQIALFALGLGLALTGCDNTTAGDDDNFDEVYTAGGKEDGARPGRFETFTGRDGKTYFHLLAGNGQLVLKSQGYASVADAQEGIDTVRFNGAHEESFQIQESVDGQWYFNLLAGNWQTIATSELYVSKSNAQRAVDAIVALVAKATDGKAKSGARFQVFQGLDGQYYFHLRAANGEIVLQSEGYTRRASAVSGTSSVSTNGTDARRYKIKDAANGEAYFVLTALNNQVIGSSETYSSRSGATAATVAIASLLQTGAVLAAQ